MVGGRRPFGPRARSVARRSPPRSYGFDPRTQGVGVGCDPVPGSGRGRLDSRGAPRRALGARPRPDPSHRSCTNRLNTAQSFHLRVGARDSPVASAHEFPRKNRITERSLATSSRLETAAGIHCRTYGRTIVNHPSAGQPAEPARTEGQSSPLPAAKQPRKVHYIRSAAQVTGIPASAAGRSGRCRDGGAGVS